MKEHETTIANADLWSKYFQDEWSKVLTPFGRPADSPLTKIAEGTGARVANWFSMVAAGPIAWLYSTNPSPVASAAEEPAAVAADDLDHEDIELALAVSAA
jgi:hypothetical protein